MCSPPTAWSQEEDGAAAATGDLPQAGAGAAPAELAAALRSAASEAAFGAGEAAADAVLRRQPKHVFVFSTAGKPIYAYRGDEAALAGLMATAEAILSVAHSKGHTLRHVRCAWGGVGACRSKLPMPRCLPAWLRSTPACHASLLSPSCRAGGHVFAFLERPPLALVAVSAFGEPPAVLRMQASLARSG